MEDLHLGWFCLDFGRLVQFRFGVMGFCFVCVWVVVGRFFNWTIKYTHSIF